MPLASDALIQALALPDLTEPGPHAIHRLMHQVIEGLSVRGWPTLIVHRGPRVVRAQDNYGLLGYAPDAVTLADTYTRWVTADTLLRTQTTSLVPGLLPRLAAERAPGTPVGMALPGLVYRRDVRDRWHCGEPHQMDLWLLMDPHEATVERLDALWQDVIHTVGPTLPTRMRPSPHPYTHDGREVEVLTHGHWLEVLECGRIAPALLARVGVDPTRHAGLALGMGMDRLVMAAKGVPDIRLLRHPDPRIQAQMQDLAPWRPVSQQPLACRDVSVAVNPDWRLEALTQRAMEALGDAGEWVEGLVVQGAWPADQVPAVARQRLGLRDGQVNLLLQLQLRHPVHSLPRAQASRMAGVVYAALHEGEGPGYGLAALP